MTVSNAATAAPVAKKQKISQFRRLLWHMNRTDLGWVTKTALTGLQLGARAKRIELLKTLPVKPEWERVQSPAQRTRLCGRNVDRRPQPRGSRCRRRARQGQPVGRTCRK